MKASTVAYAVAMTCTVAVAVSAALLTLGAIGGGGFVALRLAALAQVEDGGIVPGGIAAFVRMQDAIIDPVALLLACATSAPSHSPSPCTARAARSAGGPPS